MGNGFAKHCSCFHFAGGGGGIDSAAVTSEPFFDEGLGHSFCYLSNPNPDPAAQFYSISGASVSANASTALSTDVSAASAVSAAAFDSSTSFASYPLCPVPIGSLSGPIDRSGFLSGPLDPRAAAAAAFSGPLDRRFGSKSVDSGLRRSFSHGGRLIRSLSRKIGRSISIPTTVSKESSSGSSVEIGGCGDGDEKDDVSSSLQWAQGKAGEDRVHVVVSEDHGWIFVGIYDGFNGPDATDFLLSNLYSAVQRELNGILCIQEERRQEFLLEKRKIRWKRDWDKDSFESNGPAGSRSVNSASHTEVLKAMNRALRKTEEEFFDVADKISSENPELALMGSCVLAVLMKGEDVYIMNVGDSRAVLGKKSEVKDLQRISEDGEGFRGWSTLDAVQLTLDHSTSVEEEVRRIKREHPEDACAVMNDRVKGSLKVTRAFGAGFLKQPKWNDALLEMFRIDYVGTSPYVTCHPFLYHHKLGSRDRFFILSSDGLYQYFTNEEAVAEVESFIATMPEGDPAQHLVEEVIFRAARKAGLDFHELLEIPQGDRRRYHDDVSIIVISFEGRIWRSCV